MTVGIAAICRRYEVPTVVIAADRMVTVGEQGGVEYEDTESKLEWLVNNDSMSAVAVGAGVSTYIDEIFEGFHNLKDVNGDPKSMEETKEYLTVAYQQQVRETIENQVLQPFGYSLPELKDPDVDVPASVQQRLTEEIDGILDDVNKRVRILLAGACPDGARVHLIAGMDSNNFSDIGYGVVGSGSDSARLTFIRRQYDRVCTYREGVFTVLEAKDQAEERQGVGNRTDMATVDRDGIEPFDRGEQGDLQDKLKDIEEAERNARERVMDDWDSN